LVRTTKCLVLSTKRLVAAAKFLVEATKNSFVVPNLVAVTKPFFPCGRHGKLVRLDFSPRFPPFLAKPVELVT